MPKAPLQHQKRYLLRLETPHLHVDVQSIIIMKQQDVFAVDVLVGIYTFLISKIQNLVHQQFLEHFVILPQAEKILESLIIIIANQHQLLL